MHPPPPKQPSPSDAASRKQAFNKIAASVTQCISMTKKLIQEAQAAEKTFAQLEKLDKK